MFVTQEPEWISEDAENLRIFLATKTGKKVIETLVANRPAFETSSTDKEASFARSRDICGYELAVNTLIGLVAPIVEEKEQHTETLVGYPSLDDEAFWTQNEKSKIS